MKHFSNALWSESNRDIHCHNHSDPYEPRLCQRYDIIQKLVSVAMTHLPVERIEVPIGLIAQLSYYQECKSMHCLCFYILTEFSRSSGTQNHQSDANGRCSGTILLGGDRSS